MNRAVAARGLLVTTGWLTASRVLSQGLAFLGTLLIARWLGERGLGLYTFIAATVFVGNVFSSFGTDTLLMRELARDHSLNFALLSPVLAIQLGLSALFVGGVFAGAGWLLPGRELPALLALRIGVLGLFPLAFSTAFSATLRARLRMDLYTISLTATTLIQLAGIALTLWRGGDLVALSMALAASTLAGALISGGLCAYAFPGFQIERRLNITDIKLAVRASLPLALLLITAVVYQRLSIFMLSAYVDDAALGAFAAAARLVEALKAIPAAYAGALLPALAGQAGSLRRSGTLPLMLAYALSAALGLSLLAGPLIAVLFGPGYEGAAVLLPLLVGSLPASVLALAYSAELVSAGREKAVLLATAGALLLSALLHLLLIPRSGSAGAGWALLISEAALGVSLWALSRAKQQRKVEMDEYPPEP